MKRLIITIGLAMMAAATLAANCTWTGGAKNFAWTDADNWQGGTVPTAGDTVDLAGGVAMVDSTAFACTSVALSGGELVLTVANGVNADLTIPVTGSGTFCKAGKGSLSIAVGKLASGMTLCVDDGTLDLNGTTQTFASVTGSGTITSAVEAKLIVTSDATAYLTPSVTGAITVEKNGSGKLVMGGAKTYTGDTLLNAGSLATETNVAFGAMSGLVLHLDAARADTMTMDSDNRLQAWRSLAGDNMVMKPLEPDPVNDSYPVLTPKYQATGINKTLPCVQYGYDASGNLLLTPMMAETKISHKTIVLVALPVNNNSIPYTCPYGHFFFDGGQTESDRLLKRWWGSSNALYYGQPGASWNGGNPYIYLNGRQTWDPVKYSVWCGAASLDAYLGTTNGGFGWNIDGTTKPYVITVVVPEEGNAVSFKPGIGGGRIHWGNMTRNDDGSYRQTDWAQGQLCEILVFDRTLGDAERQKIETVLLNKWTLTHKGTDVVESPFSLASKLHPAAGTSFDEGDFDIAAAELMVDAGNDFQLQVDAGRVRTLAVGSVSGSGQFTKCGEGTLKLKNCTTEGDGNLTLCVDDGTFDLNGGVVKAKTVIGGGEIANTSGAEARLTVTNDATAKLAPKVTGSVKVVKSGSGRLDVENLENQTAGIALAGGTVAAVPRVAIESVPGCVVHLDASRRDTLEINPDDNTVTAWRSTAGDGIVFRHYTDETRGIAPAADVFPTDMPIYNATGAKGLPCLTCGAKPNGDKTLTFLYADKKIDHRTIIIVQAPTAGPNCYTAYGNPFFIGSPQESAEANRTFRRYSQSNSAQFMKCGAGWNGGNPYVYNNAVKVWEPVNGCVYGSNTGTDGHYFFDSKADGTLHVASLVLTNGSNAVSFHPAVGCGRIHWGGMTLNDDGSYRVTDWYVGSICEVLIFDRSLTDDERREIETALMEKWALTAKGTTKTVCPMPAATDVSVTADSTLDYGGFGSTIASVGLEAATPKAYPALTLTGLLSNALDLRQVSLALSSDKTVKSGQKIIAVPGGSVVGPCKSVTGIDNVSWIRYSPSAVRYWNRGLLLIVK